MVQKPDRAISGCVAVAEVEQTPDPLAPSDAALTIIRVCRCRFDQPIAKSLVISFQVPVPTQQRVRCNDNHARSIFCTRREVELDRSLSSHDHFYHDEESGITLDPSSAPYAGNNAATRERMREESYLADACLATSHSRNSRFFLLGNGKNPNDS